ncbi:hypothetical protein [Verminephrobacter aporrectodeae]|nr:hypothetical protein [Verminephrobacter aporrectodeae]
MSRTQAMRRRAWLARIAAPAALLALAGCTTPGAAPSPQDDEAALLQRARAYWALVHSNDNVAAWAYEETSKNPQATLDGYLRRGGGITYDALEVRGVRNMEADRAIVNVWMRYSLPLLRIKGQEVLAEDEWRRLDGVWHHVLRRSSALPKEPPQETSPAQ